MQYVQFMGVKSVFQAASKLNIASGNVKGLAWILDIAEHGNCECACRLMINDGLLCLQCA